MLWGRESCELCVHLGLQFITHPVHVRFTHCVVAVLHSHSLTHARTHARTHAHTHTRAHAHTHALEYHIVKIIELFGTNI